MSTSSQGGTLDPETPIQTRFSLAVKLGLPDPEGKDITVLNSWWCGLCNSQTLFNDLEANFTEKEIADGSYRFRPSLLKKMISLPIGKKCCNKHWDGQEKIDNSFPPFDSDIKCPGCHQWFHTAADLPTLSHFCGFRFGSRSVKPVGDRKAGEGVKTLEALKKERHEHRYGRIRLAGGKNLLEEQGFIMDTLIEAADSLSKVRREQSILKAFLPVQVTDRMATFGPIWAVDESGHTGCNVWDAIPCDRRTAMQEGSRLLPLSMEKVRQQAGEGKLLPSAPSSFESSNQAERCRLIVNGCELFLYIVFLLHGGR